MLPRGAIGRPLATPGSARGGRGELRDGREAARVKISVAGKGLIPDTTQ